MVYDTNRQRMLEEGVRYPMRGDWIARILIGGILSVFGFLLIPAFIVYGYLLEVLANTYDGIEDPPEWTDWGTLLIRGLVAWLIALAYSIPLILFSLVMIPVIGFGAVQDDPGAILAGTGLLYFFGMVVLGLVVAYLLPAGLTSYARTNRVGAAFDVNTVTSIAFTGEYLVAIVLAFVIVIFVGFLTSILSITVIGILLVPFIGFYANMAIAYIVATGVRNAADV